MKRVRTPRTTAARFEPLEDRRMFAAGAPDLSFSGDGKATASFAGMFGTAVDSAIQSDGKTVVVGNATTNGGFPKFAVARFNFGGSLDTTFGINGTGTVVQGVGSSTFSWAQTVAVQPDGKIVVAGRAGSVGPKWSVMRLLSNGRLDNSFDGDGMRTIDFEGEVRDAVVQSDGKIVLVGENFDDGLFSGDDNFAIARLNSNGAMDNTFGDSVVIQNPITGQITVTHSGKTQIGFGSNDVAEAVAISGSKIVIAGRSGGSTNSKIAVVRLKSDGSRDGTFRRSDGTVLASFPGRTFADAKGITIQSGGKIVVAGSTGNPGDPNSMDFALVRFDSGGNLDTSFGGAGVGMIAQDMGGKDLGFDVMQGADGNLIVAGSSNGKLALAQFTSNGMLNGSFGTGGKVFLDTGNIDPTFGVNLAKGIGWRRFAVTGGGPFATARVLDFGANTVSVSSFDPNASESGSDPATVSVARSESLPIATRVFFSISGTARGPQALANQIDYDTTAVNYPFIFNNQTIGSTSVDIPANATVANVTVTPRDDTRRESTETAIFTILPGGNEITVVGHGYEIGTNSSTTVSITDNDTPTAVITRAVSAARRNRVTLFSEEQMYRLV